VLFEKPEPFQRGPTGGTMEYYSAAFLFFIKANREVAAIGTKPPPNQAGTELFRFYKKKFHCTFL
jgi:hypothetical protein